MQAVSANGADAGAPPPPAAGIAADRTTNGPSTRVVPG
jgi:hypothetical protein